MCHCRFRAENGPSIAAWAAIKTTQDKVRILNSTLFKPFLPLQRQVRLLFVTLTRLITLTAFLSARMSR